MTICIVDDSIVVGAQLSRLLALAGHRDAKAFVDPQVALRWCLEARPALILLDFHMPAMDGLEFLAQLRIHEATRAIPVAMITGWAANSMRLAALRAGAVDVISKPFTPEEVALKVDNLLRTLVGRRSGSMGTGNAMLPELSSGDALVPGLDAMTLKMLDRLLAARLDRPARALERTGFYAAEIARAWGLSKRSQELLRRAVPLHDIGACLPMPETFDAPDFDRRQWLHYRAVASHRILYDSDSEILRLAAEIALARFEHWSGTGVPYGLAGEAIPLSARITALADMFDQMTALSPPARFALSVDRAAAVIVADAGEQFDPGVVSAFRLVLPRLRELHGSPDLASRGGSTPSGA